MTTQTTDSPRAELKNLFALYKAERAKAEAEGKPFPHPVAALVFEQCRTRHRHGNDSALIWEFARICANKICTSRTGISFDELPDGNFLDDVIDADTWEEFKEAVNEAVNDCLEEAGYPLFDEE